jgi:hypothetical protein
LCELIAANEGEIPSAGDAHTLIFVTNNSSDFCHGVETTIAPELLADPPEGLGVLRYPVLKSMLRHYEWITEAPPAH